MKKIFSILTISILTISILIAALFTARVSILDIYAAHTQESESTGRYKYVSGTYIGNGSTTCELTFEFTPIMVIVCPEGEEPTYRTTQELTNGCIVDSGWNNGFVWLGESEILISSYDEIEIDDHYASVTFTLRGNILTWEGVSDFSQNIYGKSYRYFAIG
jgi:hypothetical protein